MNDIWFNTDKRIIQIKEHEEICFDNRTPPKNKNTDSQNISEDVRKEQQAVQKASSNIGNEASNQLDSPLNLLSNEANNSVDAPNGTGSQNNQAGMGLNKDGVVSEEDSKKQSANLNEMQEKLYEDIEHAKNDANNEKNNKKVKLQEKGQSGRKKLTRKEKLALLAKLKKLKKLQKLQKAQKKLDVIREVDEDLYENDNEPLIKIEGEGAEQEPAELGLYEYIENLYKNHPAKQEAIDLVNYKKKSGQKEKITEESEDDNEFSSEDGKSEDSDDTLSKDNELTNAEKDLYPVKNWSFTPQKMEDVKGISGFSKFKNKLASIFGNVFGFIFSGFGLKQWIAKKRRSSAAEKKANLGDNIQKRRDHSVIPGWEGQKYDPGANSGEDILADFRRVPTVWSKIIADKASEGEGENERPLSPTISIYIDQPKDHSEQHMKGAEIGHAMIGIEYSRFSHVTNRYERYRVKYGFYPAFNGGISGTMGMAEYGAMVPGLLQNDASHDYTVSRRYPATARQVNAIIEASQTYADGGYGYYARNCTTFVRDMAKAANLPVSDNLFELEDVAFSDLANFGVVGAGIPGKNSLAAMEERFVSISQDEDKSYANFGNKRVTEADFEHYRQSIQGESEVSKRTYIPGSIGEKLRRETTGEIGSQSYRGKVKKKDDVKKIRTEINRHGNELNELLMRELLAEAERSNNDKLPQELIDMVRPLPRSGEVLLPIEAAHDREETAPIDQIRSARQQLSADIKKLNTIFFRYFKGDKRLSKPVMNLISLMNVGINLLDNDYAAALQTQDFDTDLGNLPREIIKGNELTVGEKDVMITPSLYEAYLQIYKSPKEAINAYYRYAELDEMDIDGYKWSLHPIDAKEFQKRKLIHQLAEQFDASHRYMLEKDSYDQQDVDYAFMQYNREKKDGASGEMLKSDNVTAGNAYISLILEKVFKGMRQRFKAFISQNEDNKQEENVREWLDNDLAASLLKNKDQMLTFLRGLKKSLVNPKRPEVDQAKIYNRLRLLIYDFWFGRVFSKDRMDMDQKLQMQMPDWFDSIMFPTSNRKKFQDMVQVLIKQVLLEDKAAEDDLVKLWRSGKNGKKIS